MKPETARRELLQHTEGRFIAETVLAFVAEEQRRSGDQPFSLTMAEIGQRLGMTREEVELGFAFAEAHGMIRLRPRGTS